MNNKLLVSMLASIVIIAGIIAFTPVEQATTLHNGDFATTGNFLTLTKHIEFGRNISINAHVVNQSGGFGSVSYTFVADSDAIITSVWQSDKDQNVSLERTFVGNLRYTCCDDADIGSSNTAEFRDILRKLEQSDGAFGFSDAIPLEAHTPFKMIWKARNDEATTLKIWITYEGGSGATFT